MPKQVNSTDKEPSLIESVSKTLDHLDSRTVQIALGAALLISIASFFAVNAIGGAEELRKLIQAAGPFGPLLFIGLKASTYVIAPLSGTPLKLAAGALFDFWHGALYALIGDLLGASLNFWIARLLRVSAVAKLAGKKALKQIDETTQHVGGWRALLAARLFLSSLYDFISYAAGLSNLPFRQFFLVSLIGGIPSTLAAAWLGDSLVSNQPLFFGLIALSVVSILLLLIVGRWLKKNHKSIK